MQQRKSHYERYEFQNSPWVQNLTQQDLGSLLGKTKDQLEAIVRDKEFYVRRKMMVINGKQRSLAVPYGKLRTVHERIKYHLNKIKQPPYLFSPRKGRSQRDNAEFHVGQDQFLSVDIRQFYPSTRDEHIFRWAYHIAGLRKDVAGLLMHLVSIDGKMPFGSPVSPILTTHVHRAMFDAIHTVCEARSLRMSLWVDDLKISGLAVPGVVLGEIREIIRSKGLKSHKIQFRSGGRPVNITGVPVTSRGVDAPRSLHKKIQDTYGELKSSEKEFEQNELIERLLSHLGTYRYHVGAASLAGRRAADRMNCLRLLRSKLPTAFITRPSANSLPLLAGAADQNNECPFEMIYS